MLRTGLAALGLAVLLLVPAGATAQDRVLEPAGDWAITHDAESCTLNRAYRDDTRLFIRSYGPQSPSQVSIVGPTMLRDDSAAKILNVGIDDERPEEYTVGIATSFEGRPMLVFQLALPRPGDNRVNAFALGYNPVALYLWRDLPADAQSLFIDSADMDPQSVQLGDLQAPMQMMFDCENELVASWGLAVSDQQFEGNAPVLNNRDQINGWFTYPPVMIRNHTSRIAPLRLRIGVSGEVEDCLVQSSNWNNELMAQACRTLTRNADFEPARDAQGNPVPALWRASIFFLIVDSPG